MAVIEIGNIALERGILVIGAKCMWNVSDAFAVEMSSMDVIPL